MIDFTSIDGARNAFRTLYNQVQEIFKWDIKGNRLQNVGTAQKDSDAVTLKQLNDAITSVTPKDAAASSLTQSIDKLIITTSLNPFRDNSVDLGTTSLRWKKIWTYLIDVATKITFSGLTASLPLKLNGSKETISAAIDLSTGEVTAILPIAKGGTNSGSAGAARTALNAANATTYTCNITTPLTGTISGTANLITGAVTGTCTITAGVIQVTIIP